MKIYENPIMNISFFETERVATDGSTVPGATGYSLAQDAALNSVSGDDTKVFNVNIAF